MGQPLQEVHAVGANLLKRVPKLCPAQALKLGECWLPILQVAESWPLILSWGAQLLEYPEDCVYLGITSEKWASCCHLTHNATNAPDVHRKGIENRPQQDLWSTVPYRHNLVGVLWDRHRVSAGQAKICNLQLHGGRNQQILWLEVSVQDAVGVAEFDAATHLLREASDMRLRQTIGNRFHVLLEVEICKLEYQRELVHCAEHIKKLHHILVRKLLQESDFPDGCARDSLLFGIKFHLFHGYGLPCSTAPCFVNFAIGALAKWCWLLDLILTFETLLPLAVTLLDILPHHCDSCPRGQPFKLARPLHTARTNARAAVRPARPMHGLCTPNVHNI
mmetsp:Transcript_54342/g.99915  ORF Transcript_54342/g.99915 Transcript_54342/m.99915 type:complete len:334 (+) Transcript_54342:252-1253(+)